MPLATLEEVFPGAPQSTYDHLREVAEESGYDLDEEMAVSSERNLTVPGYPHPIETWYQESATWQPWRARAMQWDHERQIEQILDRDIDNGDKFLASLAGSVDSDAADLDPGDLTFITEEELQQYCES